MSTQAENRCVILIEVCVQRVALKRMIMKNLIASIFATTLGFAATGALAASVNTFDFTSSVPGNQQTFVNGNAFTPLGAAGNVFGSAGTDATVSVFGIDFDNSTGKNATGEKWGTANDVTGKGNLPTGDANSPTQNANGIGTWAREEMIKHGDPADHSLRWGATDNNTAFELLAIQLPTLASWAPVEAVVNRIQGTADPGFQVFAFDFGADAGSNNLSGVLNELNSNSVDGSSADLLSLTTTSAVFSHITSGSYDNGVATIDFLSLGVAAVDWLIFAGPGGLGQGGDQRFRVESFTGVSAVPVPAALPLLLTGSLPLVFSPAARNAWRPDFQTVI